MNQIYTEMTDTINARPEQIYAILADYLDGHPHILPKAHFSKLIVEKGGIGTGTVVRVSVRAFGVENTYHLEVTEPEPGRVLQECDTAAGVTTTFTVDPFNNGQQAKVTIATVAKGRTGLSGSLEKFMTSLVTRHIYKKELQQLAAYVSTKTQSPETVLNI